MTKHFSAALMASTALALRTRAPETKDVDDDKILQDVKKTVEGFMTAFEEFKSVNDQRIKEVEKKGVATPETLDKLKKIEDAMGKGEELSQKFVAIEQGQKALKDQAEETDKILAKLEARLSRPGAGGPEEKAAARNELVNNWSRAVASAIITGIPNLSELQRKALDDVAAQHKSLNVSSDVAGGYLAPTELVLEIIKGVTEITPARQLARVRSTTFKNLEVPKRTGQFAARRVSEQGPRTETTGLEYGLEDMPLPEMYAVVDISQQMIEDSAFDMEAEIRMEADEQFSVKEGQEFVTGTGIGEMEGILVNASVGSTNSGNATLITADGLIDLKHDIKTAYARNANFLLNRNTLGSARKLKDGNGQYLWMPGIALGKPNTIDGDPYVETPDMPNEAAGAAPVAYGDFRRGYLIGDRIAMTMMRDPFTQAANGNVRFWFRRRVGGKVMLAEAIRKLICAA